MGTVADPTMARVPGAMAAIGLRAAGSKPESTIISLHGKSDLPGFAFAPARAKELIKQIGAIILTIIVHATNRK